MSDRGLEELRRAATPGPWMIKRDVVEFDHQDQAVLLIRTVDGGDVGLIWDDEGLDGQNRANIDAALILTARNSTPSEGAQAVDAVRVLVSYVATALLGIGAATLVGPLPPLLGAAWMLFGCIGWLALVAWAAHDQQAGKS